MFGKEMPAKWQIYKCELDGSIARKCSKLKGLNGLLPELKSVITEK